jgi:hypothetical protein
VSDERGLVYSRPGINQTGKFRSSSSSRGFTMRVRCSG